MKQGLPSDVNTIILEKEFCDAIESAGSLHEIGAWFKSQEYIKSIELTQYLLKSNPPQRELIVEFNTRGGSAVTKIINFFELGNGLFRFHKLRNLPY